MNVFTALKGTHFYIFTIFMNKKTKIVQTLSVTGNIYGIMIRQTFFLKMYNLKVVEQLNSIAENLKRATSNQEVDTAIASFTSLVENVRKRIIIYKI